MVPNVPIIEIADEPELEQNLGTNGESSISGDSAQDNREMYKALDSLHMLPLSDATPISVVFPETAIPTANRR